MRLFLLEDVSVVNEVSVVLVFVGEGVLTQGSSGLVVVRRVLSEEHSAKVTAASWWGYWAQAVENGLWRGRRGRGRGVG